VPVSSVSVSRDPRGARIRLTRPHGNDRTAPLSGHIQYSTHTTTCTLVGMSPSTSSTINLLRPLFAHFNSRLLSRSITSKPPPLSRPAPHPLPPEQQREFEALQRQAAGAMTMTNVPTDRTEQRHPDAPVPLNAEFDGDVNPATGERGGPKREPIQRWIQDEGDWSFKGRVSDF
jgi:Protein of unknown function (DUF1674)